MLPLVLGLGLLALIMYGKAPKGAPLEGATVTRYVSASLDAEIARLAREKPESAKALNQSFDLGTGSIYLPWATAAIWFGQLQGAGYPLISQRIADVISQRKSALDREMAIIQKANPQTTAEITPAIIGEQGDPAALTKQAALLTTNGYPEIGKRLVEVAVITSRRAAGAAAVSGDPEVMRGVARRIVRVNPRMAGALVARAARADRTSRIRRTA